MQHILYTVYRILFNVWHYTLRKCVSTCRCATIHRCTLQLCSLQVEDGHSSRQDRRCEGIVQPALRLSIVSYNPPRTSVYLQIGLPKVSQGFCWVGWFTLYVQKVYKEWRRTGVFQNISQKVVGKFWGDHQYKFYREKQRNNDHLTLLTWFETWFVFCLDCCGLFFCWRPNQNILHITWTWWLFWLSIYGCVVDACDECWWTTTFVVMHGL